MSVGVPLIFSIITLTIRSPPIDQYATSYSMEVQLNTTCSLKRESNLTLIFYSSIINQTKRCLSPWKSPSSIICDNLTYGVHYTIDGFLLCGTRNVTLAERKEVYEIGKPIFVNSTSTWRSIEMMFFFAGYFNRLMIELPSVNQSCSIEYSSTSSPYYHCRFVNLPSAQWFVLTYYSLPNTDQTSSGDVIIVYTELEDLNFTCQFNSNNRQVNFSWSNLTGSGYTNLTISLITEENKSIWTHSCDPYISQGNCSTKPYRLESGREYQISAKLKKHFPNHIGQKLDQCFIKTNLSEIPIDSFRHEFLNESLVRISWLDQPHSVQIRLKNLETNSFESPQEITSHIALFSHLTDGSIYQIELILSKINYPSLTQIPQYFIQTDLKKFSMGNLVRLSENILLIDVNEDHSSKVKLIFCIEELFDNPMKICSTSNIFDQLNPASIYNISITLQRDSYDNRFFWPKQVLSKLVSTNPTPLRTRSWKLDGKCGVEVFNHFPLNYSIECRSNEGIYPCDQLRCGCRYQLKIHFNQTMIDSLCSTSSCDIQLNHYNFTTIQIQTPLEKVENLRIVSMSGLMKEIVVDYDRPLGCFDRVILICEMIASKQRKMIVNSTICTDLIPNEFYRIYVETKRSGWETVQSDSVEIQLILNNQIDSQTRKRGITVQSVVIPCLIGILIICILIVSGIFIGIYRRRQQKSIQSNVINNNNKFNQTFNQVNLYGNPKQIYPADLDKNALLSRPIRIKDLIFEYEKLIANNYYKISNEFHKLQNNLGDIPSFTQCDQLFKNRYKDIIPYEHSRVKLIPQDEFDPGYINASFISGVRNPREYIACQGPLKSTINDHWKMIWEQHVNIIVMLTGLVERGMNKCERYWPIEVNQMEMFGEISVRVTAYVNLSTYNLRCIEIKKNEENRLIKHYTFKMWNDHTVPSRTDHLVNFIRLIRSECEVENHGPLLVHCSAGVGRSGTFIALDRLIQQFDKSPSDAYLDIYGTIVDMRRCRDKMVQNEHQYLFIYRCLKDEYQRASGNANNLAIADDPV